jgi:hypothetical protein
VTGCAGLASFDGEINDGAVGVEVGFTVSVAVRVTPP